MRNSGSDSETKRGSDKRYILGTLVNAFRLLDQLAESEDELSLSELSTLLDLPKATTYRLLVTLRDYEYVRQNEETSRYTLGLRLWELGRRAIDRLELRSVARHWLERLRDQTQETVMLVILDGSLIVYVEKLDTLQPLQINPRSLGIAPLHASASGKLFLAFGPRRLMQKAAKDGLTSYTPRTITTQSKLERELRKSRERGFVVSHREWREEMSSFSAPIWGSKDELVAGVTIAGPAERFTSSRESFLIESVVEVAKGISKELGHIETR